MRQKQSGPCLCFYSVFLWFARGVAFFAMKPTNTAKMLGVSLCHLLSKPCLAFHARIPIVHAQLMSAAASPAGEVGNERLARMENVELDSRGKVCLTLPNR